MWLDLVHDFLSWIQLINDCEESRQLSLMPWHDLKFAHQIVSLLEVEDCQLVYVLPVPHIVDLSCVLLELECFEEVVNWQFSQVHPSRIHHLGAGLPTCVNCHNIRYRIGTRFLALPVHPSYLGLTRAQFGLAKLRTRHIHIWFWNAFARWSIVPGQIILIIILLSSVLNSLLLLELVLLHLRRLRVVIGDALDGSSWLLLSVYVWCCCANSQNLLCLLIHILLFVIEVLVIIIICPFRVHLRLHHRFLKLWSLVRWST